MEKLQFHQVQFVKSASDTTGFPNRRDSDGKALPEIAVVGKSNVGKSSLLNDLFRIRGLARVSTKPGKTQLLNFFLVDQTAIFVDFPGYGYAKVPMSIRKSWGPMVENYFKERLSLHLILFLFDLRRTPDENDLSLVKWALYYKKPLCVVFTKSDKVKPHEREKLAKNILVEFSPEKSLNYLFYSVKEKGNRKTLIEIIRNNI